MKILTVYSNNSVVSAALSILLNNHEQENKKEFGSCCCGFGDRVVRRNELRGVPSAVLNVEHPLESTLESNTLLR
jgi:hypothetical protein